ncbi:MAG TPA: ATP-dependent DNA ligase [Myxococcota bacterium]
MKRFTALFTELDRTTKTSKKVDALARYFAAAPPADAAWAFSLLSGRRMKRLLPYQRLAEWAAAHAGVAMWLFVDCAEHTGDFAEAAALVLSRTQPPLSISLATMMDERVLALRALDESAQQAIVTSTWDALSDDERFVWNKILTGAFRVGVSELLVLRGLAKASGVDAATLKHRSMGDFVPSAASFLALVQKDAAAASSTRPDRPYPFALAHPLDFPVAELGPRDEWQVEWKWDGIRGQVVRREGVFIWSRGEELVSEQFPEILEAAAALPAGTVIDGEVLPWRADRGGVLGFAELQRRLNRKKISAQLRAEVPIAFLAYDVLEEGGVDVRALPLHERRARLDKIVSALADERVKLSQIVMAPTWEELAVLRQESRARHVEGYMLKRASSRYGVGRKRGDWWKWKIDPYAVDAVLLYAQHGSGKRASLYTDYTFGVWHEGELVPFAKAYSGLSDDEIKIVDSFVRRNTVEKFGPVHRVKPELVFELGFEGIAVSARHKSGIAVRFPRMLRFRTDKPAAEADTLETLRSLLRAATS